MALLAYLRLVGSRQGEIKGSVTQKGREGRIAVIAADHELLVPIEPATGAATGKRQHKPIRITKELDRATIALRTLLVTNEVITTWELQFWRAQAAAAPGGPGGNEFQHFTIRLTNARVVGIHFHLPNVRDPEQMRYLEYEEVGFTYERISWTWTDGNLAAEDILGPR